MLRFALVHSGRSKTARMKGVRRADGRCARSIPSVRATRRTSNGRSITTSLCSSVRSSLSWILDRYRRASVRFMLDERATVAQW